MADRESWSLYKALTALRWEIRNRRRRLSEMREWCELEAAKLAEREEEEREQARSLLAIDPDVLARVPRWPRE